MNVEIHNLTKTFGALRANDAIGLRFAAGQIHGVLGENGAGKSTLMKLLSGFLRPDAGEIRLNDQPMQFRSPADALRAGVGMVHQEPLDVPAFTALENVFCGSSRAVLRNRADARQKLVARAAHLGFSVDPDAPVGLLTVGQRQQLEIVRLLLGGARLLILDEPTTGISAAQARALFAALRTLAAEGSTILFVSHKLDEVATLCQTVSVLRAGRVQGAGQMAMPQPVERLLGMMFGAERERVVIEPVIAAPRILASASAQPIWQLEHGATRDGATALDDLSLTVLPGAIIGLAGLEGSGQQALLRLLSGSQRPTAGRVRVSGTDMTNAPMVRFRDAGIEYLPADRLNDGVIGAFSLTEHFELLRPRAERLVDQAASTVAARTAIADYNIKATPTTPIMALSGGNQQRALLSLVPPRSVGILLDQPTRGLDVTSALGIWARLRVRAAAGAALVFASADLDEILTYSDFVMVFFGGRTSPPLPRSELDFSRLAELIGGVGFEAVCDR